MGWNINRKVCSFFNKPSSFFALLAEAEADLVYFIIHGIPGSTKGMRETNENFTVKRVEI
jgi:hypothetical protein